MMHRWTRRLRQSAAGRYGLARLAAAGFLFMLGMASGVAGQAGQDQTEADGDSLSKRSLTNAGVPALENDMTPDQIYLEFVVMPDLTGDLIQKEGLEPHEGAMSLPLSAFTLPTDLSEEPFDAAERVSFLVPDHLTAYFDLYLYINKAESGPFAQEMLIYGQEADGDLTLQHRWLTSTGREQYERYFTTTPVGLYRLDQQRFFEKRVSSLWGGVSMDWAMFFDLDYPTRKSGLAIHSTNDKTTKYLGERASGGCIRLHPEHAEQLFRMIQDDYLGMVPEFAFDPDKGGTSRTGELHYFPQEGPDAGDPEPILKPGPKVLLIIDDLNTALVARLQDGPVLQ